MTGSGSRKLLGALSLVTALTVFWAAGRGGSRNIEPMASGAVNLLVNNDFRKTSKDLPDSWFFDPSLAGKGSVRIVAEGPKPGTLSLCLNPTARNNDPGKPLALAQMIFPAPFLGHKLQVRASLKAVSGAAAYVHLFALSRGKPVAETTISQTRNTSEFVTQQSSLAVPGSTDQLFFLVSTNSTAGSACFSDLAVFVTDPEAPTAAMSFRSAASPTSTTLPAMSVSSASNTVSQAPIQSSGVNLITNPDFRLVSNNFPNGWLLDNSLAGKGSVAIDRAGLRSGQAALCLTPNGRNSDKSKPFGVAQIFSAEAYRGKRLTVRASLKVAAGGTAFVHLFALAGDRPVGEVTFSQAVPSSTFVSQENSMDVPNNAERFLFALTTNSTAGRACFGDLFVGEGAAAATGSDSGAHTVSPAGASIRVNAAKVLRKVPAGLFGANVEWVRNGNTIWDSSKNQPNPEVVRRLREAGTSVIRYPGGGLADHFHWRDSIGPIASRPARPHVLDPESSQLVFGTAEFIALCRLVGAEPLITVNITEGTAQEAADWVAYCNKAVNAEREKYGSKAPFKVKYWEIGNEQYIDNRSSNLPNSYLPPREYVKRFLQFAAAMKAADPSIFIGAIGGTNFGAYHLLADSDWNAQLLSAAARAIDFLSIHNGYAPLVGTSPGVQFFDVYKAMMAFPAQIEANLAQLSAQLSSYGAAAQQIKIAVTEWGPLFADDTRSNWAGHTKTLGSALYVAGVLNAFLRSPRVDIATYLKVTEDNYMGWLYPNGDTKPSFEVLRLYWQHLGTQLTDTSISSPGFSSPAIGSVAAASNTPYLDGVSALNDSGSRLTLIVVNRDFTNSWSTSIQTDGFQPSSSGKVWELTANSLDANNGEDLEPRLNWAPQAQAPGGSLYARGRPGTVVARERVVTGLSSRFQYTFQPKSVTVLEMVSR